MKYLLMLLVMFLTPVFLCLVVVPRVPPTPPPYCEVKVWRDAVSIGKHCNYTDVEVEDPENSAPSWHARIPRGFKNVCLGQNCDIGYQHKFWTQAVNQKLVPAYNSMGKNK